VCGHVNSVWNVIMTLVLVRATAYAELSNALPVMRNDGKIMSTLRADFSVQLFRDEVRVVFCEHCLLSTLDYLPKDGELTRWLWAQVLGSFRFQILKQFD
jgi:hypothetical protein